MKTLLVLGTHFIDENVISEFRKMQNTPNVDAVLEIDNTNLKIDFKNRVEDKNFFGTNVKCFFFDSALNEEMQLPQFIENDEQNFAKTALHGGDYRFYYIRKFLPDYDFYWLIEYDVFCNAETYAGFLEKFTDNRADLLIQSFRKGNKNTGDVLGMDWIYDDTKVIYTGIFAVVRLSARAADFLYKRRLEHKEIFQNSTDKDKRLIFCEIFAPTELMNGGFICENLNEERVKFFLPIYLNDERIFLQPDNHLYHPVKSVKAEISKREKQYADLFLTFRKVFFIQLAEILDLSFNKKDFQICVDEKFNALIIDLAGGMGEGDLTCEIGFLKDKFYGMPIEICAVFIFEGEYLEYFRILKKYIDLSQIPSLEIFENPTRKIFAYSTSNFDNISQFANVLKILIEMTFTILREKIE